MIHCENCINWLDENLEQIEADQSAHSHIFMGCRIFGFIEGSHQLQSCRHYAASENLFTICSTCKIVVPKVCVSLGECVNCTNTDLYCVDSCIGEESRKYCTHFVRLNTEGIQLIDQDQVFDLYPTLGMHGREKPAASQGMSNKRRQSGTVEKPKPFPNKHRP